MKEIATTDLFFPQAFVPQDESLLSDLTFYVVDTETTGGKADINRVIDIAVFRFQQGQVTGKFQSLLNPGRPIPMWITGLTGIDDDMVKNSPSFHEIAAELMNFMAGGVFAAHNAPFDHSFISEEYRRLGHVFEPARFCTLRMARKIYADLPSKSLGSVCEHLMIDIWDRHRAAGDAEATTYVLKNMLDVLHRHHDVKTWGELQKFLIPPPKKKSPLKLRQ